MSKSKSKGMDYWWGASYITSKDSDSKWLQENLTDMDSIVKSTIELIDEDVAGSLAKRAEMYYRNRPKLIKIVEEIFKIHRSLAERYDNVISEVFRAKTIKADEDSSSSSDSDDKENNPQGNLQHTKSKEEYEFEIGILKMRLAHMIDEKDELFCQYQVSLEKLSNADEELNHVVEELRIRAETVSGAEKEVHKLKETLHLILQADGSNKQMEYLQTISDFEEKVNGMDTLHVESKAKTQDLMDKLARLESDAGLLKYGKRMEEKSMKTEKKPKMSSEKKFKEEMEIDELKNELLKLSEEKEALQVLYSECLEKSYKLEVDLSSAQSHVEHLTNEIINSTKKLKNVEEICVHLEKSNESLKMEVSDFAEKFMLKDRELSDKHDELEKHQGYAKDKHTHYAQFEASIEALKKLYTRSQEEQRNIAVELKKGLEMVNDLEKCKTRLEKEMKQVKEDNENLKKSEAEFMGLKEKLEGEVALQLGQSAAMQEEICNLKNEITKLKELQLVNESNRAG